MRLRLLPFAVAVLTTAAAVPLTGARGAAARDVASRAVDEANRLLPLARQLVSAAPARAAVAAPVVAPRLPALSKVAPAAPVAPAVTVPEPANVSVAVDVPPAINADDIAEHDALPDAPEPLGEPAPPKAAPKPPPERALAATSKETWIYEEPKPSAKRIGYLRAGAVVERGGKPAGRAGCDHGWYKIEPRGFVCVGPHATLELRDEVVEATQRRPDRTTLPYTYVMSGSPPPTLYARVPTPAEAQKSEPDLAKHLRAFASRQKDPAYVTPPAPEAILPVLAAGRRAPALTGGPRRAADQLVIGKAEARSGFALLSTFEAGDRTYGLTTELALLPIDRVRVVAPSAFVGLALDKGEGENTLPVVFVKSRHATRYVETKFGGTQRGEALGFRAVVPITGKLRKIGGVAFYEAKDGSLVREDQSLRVDVPRELPGWARGTRKWIDVSIANQTLVAYEGKRPVYVTLVSTGADGLGDPETTRSTVQGLYRVHTKHVSVTMDDDKEGNVFDFRDVPFVQYFKDGFALHAAYWHDDFGTPRSHGCVNLAPRDAAWLFAFTGPEVPEAWHGALSRVGTLVRTRP